MITLKSAALRIVVLLALQCLLVGTSRSEVPGARTADAEGSKQDNIYQSRGENVPVGYVVDRSLLSYVSTLSPGFDRALAGLGPEDRWLDIGAGQGRAILDYYGERFDAMHPEGRARRGRKARAVAVSIEDRRTSQWGETASRLDPGRIQYWSGKRLREHSAQELGRFQLVSDLVGGFSYTRYLSVFVEKVLGLLETNGNFYTMLLDVLPEGAADRARYPDTLFLTEIVDAGGAELKVCSWLKRITCVEVTCESRTDGSRPVELYSLRKTCDSVAVPALELVRLEAGTPPVRRFRLK